MAAPGWSTTWAGGNLDGSPGYTDSWQSATPTVTTGQSQFTTGRSLRISLPASGYGTPGGTGQVPTSSDPIQRCENYTNLAAITNGTGDYTWTTGFSAYFGLLVTFTQFPIANPSWQLITQWKNDSTGTPPCELSVNQGSMYFDGNGGGWQVPVMTPVQGQTYKIIVGLTLTTAAATSNINCWVNDTQYVTNAKPTGAGLMYSGQASYWKYGCYRDATNPPGAAVLDYGAAAASTTSYQDVSDFLDSILVTAGPPAPVAAATSLRAIRQGSFFAAA